MNANTSGGVRPNVNEEKKNERRSMNNNNNRQRVPQCRGQQSIIDEICISADITIEPWIRQKGERARWPAERGVGAGTIEC